MPHPQQIGITQGMGGLERLGESKPCGCIGESRQERKKCYKALLINKGDK